MMMGIKCPVTATLMGNPRSAGKGKHRYEEMASLLQCPNVPLYQLALGALTLP